MLHDCRRRLGTTKVSRSAATRCQAAPFGCIGPSCLPERSVGTLELEDDVLVTREGCEELTDRVPKDPRAIETLMAEGRTAAAAVSAATTPHGASTTVRSALRKGRRDAR
jgi:hypothetical protein